MKKLLLFLVSVLLVGLTAQAILTQPVTFQGLKRSNGNISFLGFQIQSIWGSFSLSNLEGSSYTFNNTNLSGWSPVSASVTGTLNFQESTTVTDVVTNGTFTVTFSCTTLWFDGAMVRTLNDDAVTGYSVTVSSDKHTLTVTIPSGKTFGNIYIYYVDNEPLSSSNTVISGIAAEYIYHGSAIKPVPTVTYNGTTLTPGSDYTVSYSGNNSAGTATLTVTGTGNYTGTVTKNYTIRNVALSDFRSLGSNTYEIATTTDLDNLAALVDFAANSCSGLTFKQTADIAYSTAGLGETGVNFTAIGGYFNGGEKSFSGTYDGQGHTISGIRLYKPFTNQNANKNQALFGRAVNATIKDVTLTAARITGYGIVGGIVGYCEGSTVQNCLVLNSTITCGFSYVGALIARNQSGNTFTANYYRGCTVNDRADATDVGVGGNGGISASSDCDGARSVHILTLPDGVTATGESVTIGGVTYYAANTTVTLAYTYAGFNVTYSVNGNAIEGNSFTMPAADATVTANVEFNPKYTFDSFTGALTLIWGEFNNDDKWGDEVTNTAVTSITATSDVSFTGDCSNLFAGFYNCESMDLNNVNTSGMTVCYSMFNNCARLDELDLSGWNTGNVTDMSSMFYNCSGLDLLDLSGWNTDNVTDMSSMFYNCSGLTSLDLLGWNTAKVTDMSWMFFNCVSLNSLDLSGWNTGNVTDMSSMFCYCSGLTSLDLSGWNTGNVIDMSGMFSICPELTSLDLSGWNTEGVTNMSSMFYDCSCLTSLDLSGWNTGKVTDMSWMFSSCLFLTSLDLSGWNTEGVGNMSSMFYICLELTTIYAGEDWSTENVDFSTDMFFGCTSLVGGMGTAFNWSHIDAEYARIDGGPSNPGYFTAKSTALRGDVNGDNNVSIGDVTALIDYLLSGNATGINLDAADCNQDNSVSIGDVTTLIDYLLSGSW